MIRILAAWSPGEIRVAAVAEGRLTDYALWRPGAPDGVGDIHRGRVTAIVPAMAGAFVALDGAEGFLPDSDGAKGLTEGSIVTVRVVRAALGGKGPRLSARGVPAEDGPAGLRHRGPDPLRELAARYPTADIVVDDPALTAALRADLNHRLTRVTRAFDDEVEAEIDGLSARETVLPSGIGLSIHPTPALVAIDVDAGGALTGSRLTGSRLTGSRLNGGGMAGGALAGGSTAGPGGARRRHLAVNAAVVPELARQIRLRNLSGAILVDLAGLKPKQRLALGPDFATALAADPLRPRFLGFTALGLAEIVRPRVRAPLHESLSGPLATGLAALRAVARTFQTDPGARLGLRAAPAVVAALEADPVALPDLARIAGRGFNIRSDPSFPAETWRIEAPNG